MLRTIWSGAFHLDAWLHTHLGRYYAAILGIGLVLAIGDNLRHLSETLQPSTGLFMSGVKLAFFGALLINQLGQLHETALRRRERKAQRGDGRD